MEGTSKFKSLVQFLEDVLRFLCTYYYEYVIKTYVA